ncbi:MAG TPA: DivIVA domain-containing protein [Acidimicrobiales bacterium]|jgi:DivIVA domain-containing protein
MELTPQSLHSVEFREARRGGYNTRDVDDFIERVAAGVGHLNERLRDAMGRADAADSRLAEAQRELDEARRRPVTAEASETDETLRRTLVLAQRTADATIKEAKEEANRVLSEARAEAARTRSEAESHARRGAEGARAAAAAEVESLIADRDKLKIDVDVLSKRLSDQRANLRNGISELQRILDDPGQLKPIAPHTLADIDRPPAAADGPDEGTNGHAPAEVGAAADTGFGGQDVAALQEPPPAPMPMPPGPAPDLGPPTQPVPFALSSDSRGPWTPSDLRPEDDEPLGPPPVPPPPGAGNGAPGPHIEGGRPSEWGKAVFDPDKAKAEADRTRFGRRP